MNKIWKSQIYHFHIDHNIPCLLPPPPQFCIIIVSNFSWVLQSSQKKSKNMVMQNLGEGEVKEVHYTLYEICELVTAVWRIKWKKIVLVIDARLVRELNPWSLSNCCSTLPTGSRTCIWLRINNLAVKPRSVDTHI